MKIIGYSDKHFWVARMECPDYMCGAILEFDALDERICPSCGKAINDTMLNTHAEVIGEITRDENGNFDYAHRKTILFDNPIKYSEYIKKNCK